MLLQTAVVSLEAPSSQLWGFWQRPARLDLVAAVHIADAEYWANFHVDNIYNLF
jgi:hypothetical protein